MPVKFVRGDMFATPGLTTFAHGCNCRGVMGAGIATEFRNRWPKMYQEYRNLCANGTFALGTVFTWQDGRFTIFNLGTQYDPGPKADRVGLSAAVKQMCAIAGIKGIQQVAMPLVGSGIGGIDPKWVMEELRSIGETCRDVTLLVFSEYVAGMPAKEV